MVAVLPAASQQSAADANTKAPEPVLHARPSTTAAQPSLKKEIIHLDVSVEDAEGKTVTSLDPWDFKIFDNDEAKKVLSFHSYGRAAKAEPSTEVILLIDALNIPFEQIAVTRQELHKVLSENNGKLTHPTLLLLLTDSGLRVQPRPSTDGHSLVKILDHIQGSVHSITPAMGSEGELERFRKSVRQMATIAENQALKPGKKLLIWIGPGWPMLTSQNFSFTEKDRRIYFDSIVELSTKIRQARMTITSVSLPWPGMGAGQNLQFVYRGFLKGVRSAKDADTGNLALKVLVTQSGGRVLGPSNDLAGQIDQCIATADAFYSLDFEVADGGENNKYHDLRIVLDKPDLIARTSSGYYE